MKVKLYIAATVLLSLLTNCSDVKHSKIKDAIRYTYDDFGETILLQGEILPFDSLWKPNRIWCEDSMLIVAEAMGDYLVLQYHKETGRKLAENVPYGVGPNEFLNCWTLQSMSKDICVFDMPRSALSIFNKDSFLLKSHVIPDKTITLRGEGSTGMVYLPNGAVVSSSLADSENLLSVYNQYGIRDSTKNVPYPMINTLDIEGFTAKRFFENRIYYNEKQDKTVLFYVYTDLIDIYDSDLKLQARIHGPDGFIPELNMQEIDGRKRAATIPHVTKFAYLWGCLTSDEIWTLYYGKSPEPGQDLQDRIFVYDYTGKPLRRYQLDYPVSVFCVDSNSRAIYGISEQPETCIIKFSINKL